MQLKKSFHKRKSKLSRVSNRQSRNGEGNWKKTNTKQKRTPQFDRVDLLRWLFFIGFAIIGLRLFSVMVLQHDQYKVLAEGQHELKQTLVPDRGLIKVQDPNAPDGTYVIADNQERDLIYAVPREIEDGVAAAEKLAPLLGIAPSELYERLNKPEDQYEPLLHKAGNAQVEAVKELEIKGIHFTKESWRMYPEKNITSHLTGFVGFDDEDNRIGQYGLEQFFNEELEGKQGFLQTERDGAGRWITIGEHILEPAQDGYDIELTIDKNIQYFVCNALKNSVEKHKAKKGTVIIMEPDTGAIQAMCNYPDFDANNYQDVENIDVFINSAVSEEWEPGSVYKTFALGAALDQGKISPSTVYHDSGSVKIGSYTIRNSDGKAQNRDVDMNFVLAESLNTGSIFAQQQIGNELWYEYVQNWGFGEKTGIELAGENAGNIANLSGYKDIYAATSTFGQGIQVTPLQLITAYASVANDGMLMKPYIVDRVILDNGVEVKTEPQEVRQVIRPQTAKTLSAMLVNVIDSGHASLAYVDNYFMAGKTGTAQVAGPDGKYHESRHNDTFVGFGPVSETPEFVMLTKLNEPQDVPWSALSAAPLFGEIADWLVDYMEIPPDREEE